MAYFDAIQGQAPQGATVGDTIKTKGGNYLIVPPGTSGAGYNPATGHWSIKADAPDVFTGLQSSAKNMTDVNTKKMQDAADAANLVSAESSAKVMDFNRAEAEKQRDWQKMMSDTAYQRQVEDLKAAGLNPLLGFMGSGGAAVGSGAAAAGHNYTGQRADVDTNATMVMASIFNALTQQETAIDVAKINSEAMLGAASLSSAANIYGADMLYRGSMDTRNPMNILLNQLLSGNAGKTIDNIGESIKQVIDRLPARKSVSQKLAEKSDALSAPMQRQMDKHRHRGSKQR